MTLRKLALAIPPLRRVQADRMRLRETVAELSKAEAEQRAEAQALKEQVSALEQQLLVQTDSVPKGGEPFHGSPNASAGPDFIDVNELLAKYDLKHHREMANNYFAGIDTTHPVMRKPFQGPVDSAFLLPGVAAVIDGLHLFNGARILDLGCGGGWLTRIFAYLGCEAYGIDLAPSAVEVARQATEADPMAAMISAGFRPYDGETIPFEDEFFDAVAIFDAFHHFHNQAEVLSEICRVLKPGGRALFHEPGPDHSKLAQSQMEMRNYGVIERDLVMEDVAAMAAAVGFEPPQMAIFMPFPMWTDLPEFDVFMGTPNPLSRSNGIQIRQKILSHARAWFHNMRVFSLKKPGQIERDSRQMIGLSAQIVVEKAARAAGGITCSVRVTNDGDTSWQPSHAGIGAVKLGVQLTSSDGDVIDRNFMRVALTDQLLRPGESSVVEFTAPANIGEGIRLDLVSEGVIWFEQLTNRAWRVDASLPS